MAPTSAGADDNDKVQKRLRRSTVALVEEVIEATQKLPDPPDRCDFDDVICRAVRDYAIKHAAPSSDPATKPRRASECAT